MVESEAMIQARRYHVQRLHLVVTAMRRFARDLEAEGFEVDLRRAPSLSAGFEAHVAEHGPDQVWATEPNSATVHRLLERLGVLIERSNQFLCHREAFAEWADGRESLRLEDFYRWQRRRLRYLMDGDAPVGGRWNFDHDNRERPPKDGGDWPSPPMSPLDPLDVAAMEDLPHDLPGAAPVGWWATSRRAALERLDHFVTQVLPSFGPHEDAMLGDDWHLAHSLLSPYLNLGLILPGEVCDRVEDAYRSGRVPINSAEGFIRQVIGWREFVWGISWLWPDQVDANVFDHRRELPPAWQRGSTTAMRCLALTLDALEARGWVHHIQRLMVLSNFANLYGIDPARVLQWMRERYVDGADWVMVPNVMGMGLWADGGRMATKPYVSGGAYINRMSDYCRGCRFDPTQRTGDDACPFTTLYWDFLARHRSVLEPNARMARQYATLDRLSDVDAVRARASWVKDAIEDGRL
jgi:deoxyribodipyrimidine photolyase-related protein